MKRLSFAVLLIAVGCVSLSAAELKRYIYSVHPDGSQSSGPGGGRGIAVLDMDRQFTVVQRIPIAPVARGGVMTGAAAHRGTGRFFYAWRGGSPEHGVGCLDLKTGKVLWETPTEYTCERPQVSVDGATVFVTRHWSSRKPLNYATFDAATGKPGRVYEFSDFGPQHRKLVPAHPIVLHPDGKRLFFPRGALDLASGALLWSNPLAGSHITLDHEGAKLYTGRHFQGHETTATWIIDADTGKTLSQVPLDDAKARCEGMEHGLHETVAFEPGGEHFWGQAGSGLNWKLRYDNRCSPPKLDLAVSRKALGLGGIGHGQTLVSAAGDYVWFCDGIVLEAKTGKFVCTWKCENGRRVMSAKHVEVNFLDGEILWTGQDQSHGFMYRDYPIDKVRSLLPAASPAKRSPDHGK
jgi:hypothetical protein